MAIEIVDGVECKWCPRCEDYIPVERFAKNNSVSDGLQSYCKQCKRECLREWRADNNEEYNTYQREYFAINPDKYRQQVLAKRLNNAIRDGKITRPNYCSICYSTDQIEGHHPSYDDGNELNVMWLCRRCHADLHRQLKEDAKHD